MFNYFLNSFVFQNSLFSDTNTYMNLAIKINVMVAPAEAGTTAATPEEVEENANKAADTVPAVHVEPCSPTEQKAFFKGFRVREPTRADAQDASYSTTLRMKKELELLQVACEHPNGKMSNFEFTNTNSKPLGSQKQPVVDVFGGQCEKKWNTFKQQRLSAF